MILAPAAAARNTKTVAAEPLSAKLSSGSRRACKEMVAGTVYLDYISDRNTGDPGLEDVCGPLNLDGIHCIVSGSSIWAGYLGSLFIG